MTALTTITPQTQGAALASCIFLTDRHLSAMATVRRMVAAGERVNGASLGRSMGLSQVTASRALRELVERGLLVRVGATSNPAFLPPGAEDTPLPPAKDYSVVVWTNERKVALERLALAGEEMDDMAQAVGLRPDQIKHQLVRQCLNKLWQEAKAKKAAKAEDTGAIVDHGDAGQRVSLARLLQWLRVRRHQIEMTDAGFVLNGTPLRTRGELLAQANLLRVRSGATAVVLE